jgi:hypothetical protein
MSFLRVNDGGNRGKRGAGVILTTTRISEHDEVATERRDGGGSELRGSSYGSGGG